MLGARTLLSARTRFPAFETAYYKFKLRNTVLGFRASHSCGQECPRSGLPPQNISEHQRCDNRGVRFDDVLRRRCFEFAPGYFFVRDGAGITAVAGGGIGY